MAEYTLRLIIEGRDAGASRALGSVNKALGDLDKKARSTGSSISSSLKSMGDSMTNVGRGLSLAVTAPLVGIAAVALNSAAKFEQSMNLVQAVTSATGDQMKAMQNKAIELGAKTVFSAGEAAEGLLELAKSGLTAQQAMEAIPGVLDLAAAGALSVASAAEITSNALNAFHLKASQAGEISNLLAAAANASSLEVSDMAQGFQMASAVFATYGQNIYDLSAALALLGNNGIKGSDAGTSLKTMMSRLAAPTSDAKGLMDKLGISVYDASGAMRQFPAIMQSVSNAMSGLNDETRNQAMYGIFGSDALRAASILLKEGEAGWDKMSDAVHKGGQAALLSDARMKGLAGAIEYWKGSVDSFLISAALPFQDFFSDIIRKAADLLTSFGSLDDGTKRWIIGIAAGAAAIGPLLLGFGSLLRLVAFAGPALMNMIPAVRAVTLGFGLLYGAYKLNLFGLGDWIRNGINRVKTAAPLAGRAIKELWQSLTKANSNVMHTTTGIRDFVTALTGSQQAGVDAASWIAELGGKIGSAQRAFELAGGGVQGFAAALSALTGQNIKIDLSPNVVKLTWGDVFDFSAGFDPGDWSKGFVKLKIGDLIDFSQDWTQGVTKLNIKDLITLDTTAGKEKLKLGDFYELDKTTGKNKLKFGDFYEWDNGKEKIKVGDFYTLDESAGKEKVKFGNWYEFDTTGDKTTIKIWDWYKLEETPTKKTIKLGDYVAIDSTKTTLKFGDWFDWDKSSLKLDFHDLLPEKISITELLFGTATAPKLKLEIEKPKIEGFDVFNPFTNFKWPEFPKVTIIWPDPPKIEWPPLPTFKWPDYNTWAWPAYNTWTWTDYKKWTWPDIPVPSWLKSLLDWNPIISVSTAASSVGNAVSNAIGNALGLNDSDYTGSTTYSHQASGTSFWRGGKTWINESGGEIVDLPRGTRIYPHDVSMAMAGAGGGGNITINAAIHTPLDLELIAYKVSQIQKRRGS